MNQDCLSILYENKIVSLFESCYSLYFQLCSHAAEAEKLISLTGTRLHVDLTSSLAVKHAMRLLLPIALASEARAKQSAGITINGVLVVVLR